MMKRFIIAVLFLTFFTTTILPPSHSFAFDSVLDLPKPGSMVSLSLAYEPLLIKGLRVHQDNPFMFDFVVDAGQSGLQTTDNRLKTEADRLIKYFFACLTIPERDLWVNLSPYEKQRIAPETLGQTALGRDLLAQDYILKQLTASLIYPEKGLGKEFWDRIYAKAQELYGTQDIPMNTFNKVWILADKATVYEHGQTAFVVDGHLKVMLEEDYLALKKHQGQSGDMALAVSPSPAKGGASRLPSKGALDVKATQRNLPTALGSQIIRELILPELEREVNTAKNFAPLRQIFNSLILAQWYKKNLKEALMNQVYSDKSTVKGIDLKDPSVKEQIYQQYLKAYKKGVFNYIKEEPQADGQRIPKKYFSGGFGVDSGMLMTVNDGSKGIGPIKLRVMNGFMSPIVITTVAQAKPIKGTQVVSPGKGFDQAMVSSNEAGIQTENKFSYDGIRTPGAMDFPRAADNYEAPRTWTLENAFMGLSVPIRVQFNPVEEKWPFENVGTASRKYFGFSIEEKNTPASMTITIDPGVFINQDHKDRNIDALIEHLNKSNMPFKLSDLEQIRMRLKGIPLQQQKLRQMIYERVLARIDSPKVMPETVRHLFIDRLGISVWDTSYNDAIAGEEPIFFSSVVDHEIYNLVQYLVDQLQLSWFMIFKDHQFHWYVSQEDAKSQNSVFKEKIIQKLKSMKDDYLAGKIIDLARNSAMSPSVQDVMDSLRIREDDGVKAREWIRTLSSKTIYFSPKQAAAISDALGGQGLTEERFGQYYSEPPKRVSSTMITLKLGAQDPAQRFPMTYLYYVMDQEGCFRFLREILSNNKDTFRSVFDVMDRAMQGTIVISRRITIGQNTYDFKLLRYGRRFEIKFHNMSFFLDQQIGYDDDAIKILEDSESLLTKRQVLEKESVDKIYELAIARFVIIKAGVFNQLNVLDEFLLERIQGQDGIVDARYFSYFSEAEEAQLGTRTPGELTASVPKDSIALQYSRKGNKVSIVLTRDQLTILLAKIISESDRYEGVHNARQLVRDIRDFAMSVEADTQTASVSFSEFFRTKADQFKPDNLVNPVTLTIKGVGARNGNRRPINNLFLAVYGDRDEVFINRALPGILKILERSQKMRRMKEVFLAQGYKWAKILDWMKADVANTKLFLQELKLAIEALDTDVVKIKRIERENLRENALRINQPILDSVLELEAMLVRAIELDDTNQLNDRAITVILNSDQEAKFKAGISFSIRIIGDIYKHDFVISPGPKDKNYSPIRIQHSYLNKVGRYEITAIETPSLGDKLFVRRDTEGNVYFRFKAGSVKQITLKPTIRPLSVVDVAMISGEQERLFDGFDILNGLNKDSLIHYYNKLIVAISKVAPGKRIQVLEDLSQARGQAVESLIKQGLKKEEIIRVLKHLVQHIPESKETGNLRDLFFKGELVTIELEVDYALNVNTLQVPEAFPGGIDLTDAQSGLTIQKDAQGGVKVSFDVALIAQIQKQGVDSVVPVIVNVRPMTMAEFQPMLGSSP